MASTVPCGIGGASLRFILESFIPLKLEIAADIFAIISGGLGFPLCLIIAIIRFRQAKGNNITLDKGDNAVRYLVRNLNELYFNI